MASEYTQHYNLDLYTDNDKPNLRDQYNGAINKIDGQLHQFSNNMVIVTDAANQAKERANAAQTTANANGKSISDIDSAYKAADTKLSSDLTTAYKKADDAIINEYRKGHNDISLAVTAETTRATAAEKNNSNSITRNTNEIANINTKLNKIQASRNIIVTFGDSYAIADNEQNTWTYQLGQIGGYVIKNYAVSGAGFNYSQALMLTQLQNAIADKTLDHSNIKALVVAGGRNDIMSFDTASSRAFLFVQTALSAFPGIPVYVVPMLYDWNGLDDNGRAKAAGIADGASRAGGCVVNWAWTWLIGEQSQFQGNGDIHPNANGARTMASYINSALNGSYSGRHMITNTKWNGAPIVFEGRGGTVTVQLSGDMSSGASYSDFVSVPEWAKTGNRGFTSIGYSNSGTQQVIYFIGNTFSVFNGNKLNIGGGVGMNCSYPW